MKYKLSNKRNFLGSLLTAKALPCAGRAFVCQIIFYLFGQLFKIAVDEHQIKDYRNDHRCQFCKRYGQPDPVDTYQWRQRKQGCQYKDQRTQQRDDTGDQAVADSGVEAGDKDVEAQEDKAVGEHSETVYRQVDNLLIITDVPGDNTAAVKTGQSENCQRTK